MLLRRSWGYSIMGLEYVKASSSHFTGKVGEDYVSFMFHKNNIACTSLASSDFGEDILCDIFVASNNPKIKVRTEFSFRTQVKSTECLSPDGYIRKTAHGCSVSLPVELLNTWKASYYPIVLVIYDCSASCAYWCFPAEQITNDYSENKTQSISVNFEDLFDDDGINRIRAKIIEYYSNLFKLQDASLKCSIFPIWMPQYRLLTMLEIHDLFPAREGLKQSYKPINLLPSYISSYHTCQYGETIYCLEYSSSYQSLDSFVTNLVNYLNTINYTPTEEKWLSLIISPIDIVTKHENRRISTATDWVSLSLLSSGLIYDHSHNFELGPNYYHSEKTRALSDDSDLFIHKSGDFAVETLVESYLFNSRKQQSSLTYNVLDKSMCILDISECTELQITTLEEWCHNNDHQLMMAEDAVHAIIAHPFISFGSYGSTLPGTATWNEWDKLTYNTPEFSRTIPCGIPLPKAEKLSFLDNYLSSQSNTSDTCLLDYSHAIYGETLLHNKRTIRLICYISPMDPTRCNDILTDTMKKLHSIYPNCCLYCDEYDDLWDIILDIAPETSESTQHAVSLVEETFHVLVAKLKKESNTNKNMAYYTKMLLNRWIPSCIPIIS